MKKSIKSYIIFTLLFLGGYTSYAQTLSNKLAVSIQIDNYDSTSVQFSWSNFSIQSTEISRKLISSSTWTVIASNLTATSYVDSMINNGVEYEYQFKVTTGSTPALAYGYIAFGVNVPAKSSRGRMLLLVDDRFTATLSSQLTDLQRDLISDGWQTTISSCSKDASPVQIKRKIDSINSASTLSAVYLIGHVPVPYSGAIRPDGHGDHFGAWPTDLFYVTDTSLWSDVYYNFTNGSRPANSNYFSDGVYDNGIIPGKTHCSISRIDFYNMPNLSDSEATLLANYLDKASEYKRGVLQVSDEGIIDNQIANYGEGLSVSAEMSFPSLVSTSYADSSLTRLSSSPTKWYMAASFANDTSMSNIGSVSVLDTCQYQGVFSLLFGSYFGDWNTQNNYMRAILANGKMLTSCWAGRPNWYFHHMGLNNPIGLSAKKSIDNGRRGLFNSTPYQNSGNSSNGIHMALMGDLSLRNSYVEPVKSFGAEMQYSQVSLSWSYSAVEGNSNVLIYSSMDSLSGYSLIQTLPGTDSSFIDYSGSSGTFYYIKRVRLDSTLSGSYFNNSIGIFTAVGQTVTVIPVELMELSAELVGDNDVLVSWSTASELNNEGFVVERRMAGEQEFSPIDFVNGNGTTSVTSEYENIDAQNYWNSKTAYYRLKQLDFDGNYAYSPVVAVSKETVVDAVLYPNPAKQKTSVSIVSDSKSIDSEIVVRDVRGVEVSTYVDVPEVNGSYDIDVSALRNGTYYVELLVNNQKVVKKLMVTR